MLGGHVWLLVNDSVVQQIENEHYPESSTGQQCDFRSAFLLSALVLLLFFNQCHCWHLGLDNLLSSAHYRLLTNICIFHPLDTSSSSSFPHDNQKRLFIVVVQSLSHVGLFATPLTVARQAPLSIGFPKQESWCALSFSSPGDLPDPRIEPIFPALELLSHQGSFIKPYY